MRIAHFTDIHVTADPSKIPWRDLLSKRLLGWINLRFLGRHHVFAETGDVLRAFVADLELVKPDHVVCTGDLTGLALPWEFEQARAYLEPLLHQTGVTGIPGNHDVYVRSAARACLFEGSFGSWVRTDLSPEDFPEEFRHLYPYPLVRSLDAETVLIALCDVRPNAYHDSSGRVGRPQLRLLAQLLDDPRLRRPVKILAHHTSFLRAADRRDAAYHRLRDAPALLELAARAGVTLLIHGHTHHRFAVGPGPLTPVAVANPGSLTASTHDRAYHVYEVTDGKIRVEVRRYDAGRRAFMADPGETKVLDPTPLGPR